MKLLIIIVVTFFLTITCYAQNDPPIAVNDTVEVLSQVSTIIDALANDTDPNGDQFLIKSFNNPARGILDTMAQKFIYKSDIFEGQDQFRYRVSDQGTPSLNSNYAYVYLNVLPNPNCPTSVEDSYEVMQLVPISLDILSNDFDPNGDAIKIGSIKNPYNCLVTVHEDSLSISVKPGINGNFGFFDYCTKEANTQNGLYSSYTTVHLYISPNPDIPVVVNDTANAIGGILVDIPVLINDYDPQNESIEIFEIIQPPNGTVSKNGEYLRYLPNFSFKGNEFIHYTIRESGDTNIYSNQGRVFVDVDKNPNCPVGVADYASGITALPVTIHALNNDYDINGDPIEIYQVDSPNGTFEIDGNSINYTSGALSIQSDSLFYRVRQSNDHDSYSERTPIYLQLATNPDLPIANNDTASTRAGISVIISPLLNDVANTADSLIINSVELKSEKGISSIQGHLIQYTPYYNSSGKDFVAYTIVDKNNPQLMAKGQLIIDVENQKFYDSIAINNINAGVNANGMLFSNIHEIPVEGNMGYMEAHFRFDKSALKNTIFSSSLWIGGLDQNDSLHLAAEKYKQTGIDFQAGPVSSNYGSLHYLKYARTWKISKEEIDFHQRNYWKTGYQPIEAIASWPGNGDVTNGESNRLAPFFDQNNDDVYMPQDGDYPLIRGDQTIFIMYNDDLNHTETGGNRLKVEIHAMIYGYNMPFDTALSNTVLVHYDLINRSEKTYLNTYLGYFTDFDIGNAVDDYIGCDVMRGTYYGYNGDASDEIYGDNPPAQSVTILAGPFIDSDGIDNPSGGCDESVNGLNFGNGIADDERLGLSSFTYFNNSGSGGYGTDPSATIDYYNYMTSLWRDQSPFLYGGNGHISSGATGPACKFVFPGDSDPFNWGTSCQFPNNGYNQNGKFWTEQETGNVPADRRGLGVIGPFTFKPGDIQEVEIAFCAARANPGGNALNALAQSIDSLFTAVSRGEIILPNNELALPENVNEVNTLGLYPNPANDYISVVFSQSTNLQSEYVIYNIYGNICQIGQINGKTPIDISRLSHGFYIIQIASSRSVLKGRFIKK